MNKLFNFAGLWEPDEEGKTFASGKLPFAKNPKYPNNADVEALKNFIRALDGKGIRVLVFKNDRWEEGSRLPKYNLCLAVDEPKEAAPQDDSDVPF